MNDFWNIPLNKDLLFNDGAIQYYIIYRKINGCCCNVLFRSFDVVLANNKFEHFKSLYPDVLYSIIRVSYHQIDDNFLEHNISPNV